MEQGKRTAATSSNSVRLVASGSSHPIRYVRPGLVVEAVREAAAAARSSSHRLPPCGAAFTSLGGLCQ